MGWFDGWLGRRDEAALALYDAVVARAREPHWYLDGAVPDTVDGRFDMVAAVLSLVLLRLETEAAAAPLSAQLTERFVDDMDSQLRQKGIGDVVVGKHMGKMMAMLGGRLGAYRDGIAAGTLGEALVRNLYRGVSPGEAAVAHVERAMLEMRNQLATTPLDAIAAGTLP
ncbi:MAG TPA: ubiquinol-cytochrome C chaperone family protein [Sphingomonas sp.]|jgi:cytochrome b pre-mRNA-processing protein 3